MTELKKLSAALNTIGTIFTEMYDHTDRQTGVVTERNRLGFLQDKVLNGVCFQLASSLDYTNQRTLPQAQASVKRNLRNHDGTEIAENNLQASLDWIDRLNEQVALTEQALEIASAVYEKHTGNTFSFGRKPEVNEGVTESPAVARARALGIKGNVGAGYGTNRGQ